MWRNYGDFISQHHWDWYCTLTFRRQVSNRNAFKLFNRWKVALKKVANHGIEYILIIESGNSTPHIHVLVDGVQNERPYVWK